MIPESEWKWHGLAGHFICADKCIFRLHTTVGRYKISTVGAMYRDLFGKRVLEEVGVQRHYETYVFDIESEESLLEIDSDSLWLGPKAIASSRDWDLKAEKMHDDMCCKYAKIQCEEIDPFDHSSS